MYEIQYKLYIISFTMFDRFPKLKVLKTKDFTGRLSRKFAMYQIQKTIRLERPVRFVLAEKLKNVCGKIRLSQCAPCSPDDVLRSSRVHTVYTHCTATIDNRQKAITDPKHCARHVFDVPRAGRLYPANVSGSSLG